MDKKPYHRFRFSLRTLFVIMTAIGVWLGVQLNWIRQRHDAEWLYGGVSYRHGTRPAPWSLRILGEDGVESVSFKVYAEDSITFERRKQERMRHLERLFPEAKVSWNGYRPALGFIDQ